MWLCLLASPTLSYPSVLHRHGFAPIVGVAAVGELFPIFSFFFFF